MFTHDPRTNARIVALQELFAEEFSVEDTQMRDHAQFRTDYDADKTKALVHSVRSNQPLLDELIKKYATQRPIEDMNAIDVCVLRLAIVEAFILEQAPVKVVIDEAVEMAKEFGGPTSHKLVNGVLGAIFEHELEYIKQHKHG